MADEQKTLIDITALKYFYKSLQNVTVLIAPSSVEAASAQNLGRTYFIPADGTYAGLSCKKGDHIVSNGTTWVLIPKGTSEGGTTYYAGTGIDISKVDDKDTITNTGVTKVEESDDAHKGTVKVTTKDASSYVPVHGLGTAAYADVTDTYAEDGTVPVSGKAVKSAISGKLDASQKGANGGVAELDESGKVLSSQLPSYVDDVIEASSRSEFPTKGESGKIYVDTTANLTYRWTGTAYTEISPSIALGETASTAFRGDHGKTAYDHATTTATNPHGTTKSDVGLGNVDNTSDTDKPISTATQTALNGKVPTARKVNGKALSADVTLSGADVAVTGYSKASTASAIAATDTVNVALGKVEKALDGKQNTLSFMTTPSSTNPVATKTEISLIENAIKGTADGQFITDENAVMTKTVPEKCKKGVVAKISGKTVKSRNILNHTATSGTSASGTLTWTVNEDKSITLNGTTTEVTTIRIIGVNGAEKEVVFNGTNSIIWCSNNSTIESGIMSIKASNQGTAYSEEAKVSNPVCTIVGDITYLYMRISANRTLNNVTIYPMLVHGTTTDTTYEPYFEGLRSAPVESVVSQGANLLRLNDETTKTSGGVTCTYNNDGSVTLNGTSTATATFPLMGSQSNPVYDFATDTYSLIWSDKSGTTSQNGIGLKLGDTKGGSYDSAATPSVNIYTITGEIGYIYFRASSGRTFDNLRIYPMLVKGTATSTEYSPYNKTTVLVPQEILDLPDYGCSVGDVYNYIDFEEMKYHHNVKKIKVKDVVWTKNSDSVNSTYTSGAISDMVKGTRAHFILMSKYECKYNKEAFDPNWNNVVYIAGAAPSEKITIVDGALTTLDDFYTINAEEDIIYELATPEVIDLSDILTPFVVEPNGTIEFVNEHNLDVNNTVLYKKEVL